MQKKIFFLSLLSIVLSFDQFEEFTPALELKSAYVIFRHGQPELSKEGQVYIQEQQSSIEQEITTSSKNKLLLNGQTTFKRYFKRLLQPNFSLEKIVVRTLNNSVAIQSVKQHIDGFIDQYTKIGKNTSEELTNLLNNLHKKITIRPPEREYLSPPFLQCPFIQQVLESNKNSQNAQKLMNFLKTEAYSLAQKMNELYQTEEIKQEQIHDYYNIYTYIKVSGLGNKLNLTLLEEDQLIFLHTALTQVTYFNNKDIGPYISAQVLSEMLQLFQVQDSFNFRLPLKLFIVSALDITLQGIYNNLNLSSIPLTFEEYLLRKQQQQSHQKKYYLLPEYTETLRFEMYFDKKTKYIYISILLNNNDISEVICGKYICVFEDFEKIIQSALDKAPSYSEVCYPFQNPDKITKPKKVDTKKYFK